MSELQEMQEPLVAEVRDWAHRRIVQGRTTAELGATKIWHADCPCCGYRFGVDPATAEEAMLNRQTQALKLRVRDRIQHWFTTVWGWKTKERELKIDHSKPFANDNNGPNWRKGVSSKSIDMVFQADIGKGLRAMYRKATKTRRWKRWFAVLWHDAPVVGEMFFACRLADLFDVLQGIGDDSPEFAFRLRQAADLALKRDGSAAGLHRDNEPAPNRGEGGVQGFDPFSAVNL